MTFYSKFSVASQTGQLDKIRVWLDATQSLVGNKLFPKNALVPVKISIVEAVNNAIFHAHDQCNKYQIDISFSCESKKIEITVSDFGSGIDQLHPEMPDAMALDGRGLSIINNVMTHLESITIDDKHHLKMVYNI